MSNKPSLLRCMTFNIRYDNPEDENNSWTHRKDFAASMIRFHRADIVGLQEVLKHQLEDLGKLLPEFGWLGIGREDGKEKGEYSPIFYRKNRVEPLLHGTFWLSETPEVPGKKGWDAACARLVTWTLFVDKESGQFFFHFNTHFDHVGRVAQEKSAILLLDRIDKIAKDAPVVVTGDFNCTEVSKAYAILTGQQSGGAACLKDAKYASLHDHHGPTVTFHGFKMNELAGNDFADTAPIDFLFVNKEIAVLHHGVLADHWNGKYPSDHLPVVADIILHSETPVL